MGSAAGSTAGSPSLIYPRQGGQLQMGGRGVPIEEGGTYRGRRGHLEGGRHISLYCSISCSYENIWNISIVCSKSSQYQYQQCIFIM